MLNNFIFHHIGYVTESIENTAKHYKQAGYQSTPVIEDPIQRVRICFISKLGFPSIELVEPNPENASLNKLLKKSGTSPYHICYEVDDIHAAFDKLVNVQGYTPLFRPVEAAAMDGRLICYLYHSEVGFIELVNQS